jgi:hypothetical protein
MRFIWGEGLDVDELQEELSKKYPVSLRKYPGDDVEVSLFKDDRVELVVTADRMRVHMNAHRAILSQIAEGPFTKRDMELRAFILEHYMRNRPTPFPWSTSFEPEFEVEE